MKIFKNFLIAVLFITPAVILAAGSPASVFLKPEIVPKDSVTQAFRYYKNVSPKISVPSVVEVPFGNDSFSIPVFAVYNVYTTAFEPHFYVVNNQQTDTRVVATASVGTAVSLTDNNYSTYLEFPLTGDSGQASITFNFDKPITTSNLSVLLDSYVASPQGIAINAMVGGKDSIVLARTRPTGSYIVFPKTTSSQWTVVFDYVQPLRITEMKFQDLSAKQVAQKGLRFLAQPGQSYQIYFDADRYVQSSNRESGDLFSNQGVVYPVSSGAIANPQYHPLDSDNDSIADFSDNCVSVANFDQIDSDSNGKGDACEDYDRDGVVNSLDNCRDIPNAYQEDTEHDGVGDACDNRDNRVTERMPWLPWVGIGVAGVVLFGLFAMTIKHKAQDSQVN